MPGPQIWALTLYVDMEECTIKLMPLDCQNKNLSWKCWKLNYEQGNSDFIDSQYVEPTISWILSARIRIQGEFLDKFVKNGNSAADQ